MHRGLLLSSDIKSARAPWAPGFPERRIQAPALSDPVWQFVPWLRLARRELASGRLPLWNPHQDGGVPLLGNAQSALLSPLNWPVLLLGADPGWNLSLLARILLAAAGAFAFLRDLGRSRISSALGAAAFALSGAFVAWLEHPLALSAAPAPLVLLFARRAARDRSARAVAGLALSAFLVLAGGHPETALMIALVAAVLVAASRPGWRGLLCAAAGAALGAGLAAPMLLPFAEYFRNSAARLGEGRRPFVLASGDLLRFLEPRLSGSNAIEAAATVSVVMLLLVPIGLWAGRRDREIRFWTILAAVLLAVIYDNPLSRALALSTPVYWTRFLLLLPLALGVMGSAGLDHLRGLLDARSRFTALAGAGGLAVIAILELLRAARGVHGVTPPSQIAPTTPLLAKLEADNDVFRVLPLHTFLSPNSATDYGLDDVRGYDALAPAAWRRRRAAIGKFADLATQRDAIEPWDLAPGGQALDEWNVKYLMLPPQFAFGASELNARKGLDLEEIYSGPDGRLFRNRRAKPRVRWEGQGAASVAERAPGLWRIDVRAEEAGLLRVVDPYFPGWKARIDGAEAVLAARPGEPMAVAVARGTHHVAFAYRPTSFRVGVVIGFVSVLVVGVALLRVRRAG